MPNFLILGAAKAGTTALHQYFQQHPDIYMTPSKETNFFAYEGKDVDFKGPGDDGINTFSITSLEKYQAEFSGVTHETAIGEACPLYLYEPNAVDRIAEYIPNAKLIVILRDPVERAYANFLHLVRDGRETVDSFDAALQNEESRLQKSWEWFWSYSQIGFYGQQLQRYYDRFGAEQIQVYLFDDFKKDPLGTMQQMFRFIGVDDTFSPDMSERPNKSGKPKNAFLHQLLTKPNPLKAALKPLFPKALRQKIQHQNLTTPQLETHTCDRLRELYREDLLQCQSLIGRDLSAWC